MCIACLRICVMDNVEFRGLINFLLKCCLYYLHIHILSIHLFNANLFVIYLLNHWQKWNTLNALNTLYSVSPSFSCIVKFKNFSITVTMQFQKKPRNVHDLSHLWVALNVFLNTLQMSTIMMIRIMINWKLFSLVDIMIEQKLFLLI